MTKKLFSILLCSLILTQGKIDVVLAHKEFPSKIIEINYENKEGDTDSLYDENEWSCWPLKNNIPYIDGLFELGTKSIYYTFTNFYKFRINFLRFPMSFVKII